MQKKYLLAFDCSCAGAGITLFSGDKARTRTLPPGGQAVGLVPAIDELMREAGVKYEDLAAIITTTGPGSFTGLRIGLAALHGIALVAKTPIKLVTTLEAMAWSVLSKPNAPASIVTALKAGKGELAIQTFGWDGGKPAAKDEIRLVPETHTDWGAPDYGNHLPESAANYLPDADTENLCRIASLLKPSTLADALPLYIRPPDALIPKTPAWLAS